ncbi:hypothetical protein BDZ94DRAFT_1267887 [Collybia nuda]|uniref:Uncharacterized protein n=1 Tax=Collybia nuda TaxID=64659 RepID=A0A9P6CBK7_9AGAR|nr:hypothetical protein BDZ94DRAFT_1267887 [Collybia nuda]
MVISPLGRYAARMFLPPVLHTFSIALPGLLVGSHIASEHHTRPLTRCTCYIPVLPSMGQKLMRRVYVS